MIKDQCSKLLPGGSYQLLDYLREKTNSNSNRGGSEKEGLNKIKSIKQEPISKLKKVI